MPSLICTTKDMAVGWGGRESSQLFLQLHIISCYAEGDRGHKSVWIPIPQRHPNPWGPMHYDALILIITFFFFFTKSLERHRHSSTGTLAPEGCSDSTPDMCLKSLSFCSSYGAVQMSDLHVLYIQGQDTALDIFALLMGFLYPFFASFTFSFLFLMWHASLEARYWAVCNKQST